VEEVQTVIEPILAQREVGDSDVISVEKKSGVLKRRTEPLDLASGGFELKESTGGGSSKF
jgi:hypothetical protein